MFLDGVRDMLNLSKQSCRDRIAAVAELGKTATREGRPAGDLNFRCNKCQIAKQID